MQSWRSEAFLQTKARALQERTRDELYNLAKELDIQGRSKMSKDELLQAIHRAGSRKVANHGHVAG